MVKLWTIDLVYVFYQYKCWNFDEGESQKHLVYLILIC